MSVSQDILEALRREWTWLEEGPSDPDRKAQVYWTTVENWEKAGFVEAPDHATEAVVVDGEVYFGQDLERFRSGSLADRNPRYVVFREVLPETGVRRSVVAIRRDLAPEDSKDLEGANYL